MINVYKNGQKVRCIVAFSVDGTLTDPSTVTFKSKSPSGTTTTLVFGTDAAVQKDSTGNYHVDVIANESGEWNFRFEGTGTCTAVEEQAFQVISVF